MKLSKRVAVVTGGGAGIGLAVSRALAAEGAMVVIADIDAEAGLKAAESIVREGYDAFFFKCDVSDPASVDHLKSTVSVRAGAIDILVNNAALQINQKIEQTTIDQWQRQLDVNLTGMFLCCKTFMPDLRYKRGTIINMSSVNAYFVEPGCAGYCATKAAIIGFTKALAIDHGHEGIRVNAVCPGYINAGGAIGYFEAQPDPALAREQAGKLHALGRIGHPEEVAKAVVFLASNDASFITGSAMVVDGGFGAGLPPKF